MRRTRRVAIPLTTCVLRPDQPFGSRPRCPRMTDHLGCAGDAGPAAAGPRAGRGRGIRLRQHPDLKGLLQAQPSELDRTKRQAILHTIQQPRPKPDAK